MVTKEDWLKAVRKRRICREVYGWEYYNNLHQYSSNKIHCSCPMCRGENWSVGKNSIAQHTLKDQRKIVSMMEEEEEWRYEP